MQLPVDVKAVIDEATDIGKASQTPLSISIYMDETAPGDIQAHVRQAFASASEHARVSIVYFPSFPVVPAKESDMAVIVAGLDDSIGKYAAGIREAGVPVMVVTTMPKLVAEIAEASGYPVLKDDLVFPVVEADRRSLPAQAGAGPSEPIALTDDAARSVSKRMGEWVVDACSEKRLAFAFAFRFVRKPLALEAVNATAVQNAGIGVVVFIPGADMPIMTLNQAKMLLQIAAAYGQPMSMERVKELVAVVGGAFAFRGIARQMVAFVPALGWAIKGAIGYGGTVAMGRAAIEYFESDGHIDHFIDIVARARDKAMGALETVASQPDAKTAVQSAATAAGDAAMKTARNAAANAMPAAGALAESALGAIGDAGAIPGAAARVANAVNERLRKPSNNNPSSKHEGGATAL